MGNRFSKISVSAFTLTAALKHSEKNKLRKSGKIEKSAENDNGLGLIMTVRHDNGKNDLTFNVFHLD